MKIQIKRFGPWDLYGFYLTTYDSRQGSDSTVSLYAYLLSCYLLISCPFGYKYYAKEISFLNPFTTFLIIILFPFRYGL